MRILKLLCATAIGFTAIAGARPASAATPPALTLPGQVGPATAYTTPHGTAAWTYYVYAGGPADDAHYARVAVPAAIDTTAPTPTVLAVHGATATEEQLFGYSTATTGGNAMLNSWLDRGWPVIATREGETVKLNANGVLVGQWGQWGNERSAAGMADAWPWARTSWTPDPHGFLIYGWSMGGAGALNAAAELERRGDPVGAVDAIDGATNLAYNYGYSTAFARNIRAAYSLPAGTVAGDAAWHAGVDVPDGGHDANVIVPGLVPFPLRMSASSADPTVNKANNSLALYTALTGTAWSATAEVSYWSYGAGHCAKSHFSPVDANAFFDRALAR